MYMSPNRPWLASAPVHLLRVAVLLLSTALLAACGGGSEPPTQRKAAQVLADSSPVIADVDGEPVTLAVLEAFASARQASLDDPEERALLLQELATQVTLRQQAQRIGLPEDLPVLAQLEMAELELISRAVVQRFLQDNPITEERIVEHYQRQAARDGNKEFAVRHILFADEAPALAAVDRALDGEDFSVLIAESAGTAIQARDLGWVRLGQLPPEFADAVTRASDGMVLPTPVITDFGYHVIHRAASRDFSPPPLDSVRDGIRNTLSEQAARDYVDALRSRARVNERP